MKGELIHPDQAIRWVRYKIYLQIDSISSLTQSLYKAKKKKNIHLKKLITTLEDRLEVVPSLEIFQTLEEESKGFRAQVENLKLALENFTINF